MYKISFPLGRDDTLPKIAIMCGVHGNETHAVSQVIDLIRALRAGIGEDGRILNNSDSSIADEQASEPSGFIKDLASKYKEITFVTGINELGLAHSSRDFINPGDDSDIISDRDFNREFSFEKKYDNINEAKQKIIEIIERNDIIIDVHNSPLCENTLVFGLDPSVNSMTKIAKDSGLRYIVANSLTDGIIKNYINNKIFKTKKVGLTVELNGMGWVPMDISEGSRFFLSKVIMNGFKFLNRNTFIQPDNSSISIDLISPAEGIISYNKVEPLSYYGANELIAFINGLDGYPKGVVYAPMPGRLVALQESLYVTTGRSFGTFVS